jgi:hypothetical protein
MTTTQFVASQDGNADANAERKKGQDLMISWAEPNKTE